MKNKDFKAEILYMSISVFFLLHACFMWLIKPYHLLTGSKYYDVFIGFITNDVFLTIWTIIPMSVLAFGIYSINRKMFDKE